MIKQEPCEPDCGGYADPVPEPGVRRPDAMTAPERFDPWASIDFDALAGKLQDHMADLIHHVPPGEPQLHGSAGTLLLCRTVDDNGKIGYEVQDVT